jgi:hypothetical protein
MKDYLDWPLAILEGKGAKTEAKAFAKAGFTSLTIISPTCSSSELRAFRLVLAPNESKADALKEAMSALGRYPYPVIEDSEEALNTVRSIHSLYLTSSNSTPLGESDYEEQKKWAQTFEKEGFEVQNPSDQVVDPFHPSEVNGYWSPYFVALFANEEEFLRLLKAYESQKSCRKWYQRSLTFFYTGKGRLPSYTKGIVLFRPRALESLYLLEEDRRLHG